MSRKENKMGAEQKTKIGIERILIVEDQESEQEFARKIAESRGLETVIEADFSSALRSLEEFKPNYVLTDLFFPGGSVNSMEYATKILPFYEQEVQNLGKLKIREDSPLVLTIKMLTEKMGFASTEETYKKLIEPLNKDSPKDLELARNAVYGIQNFDRYRDAQAIVENLKQGNGVPFGYFLAEELRKRNIPSAIITSTNHHAVSFSPIERILPIKYFADLVNGKKDWSSGLDYVLKGGEVK